MQTKLWVILRISLSFPSSQSSIRRMIHLSVSNTGSRHMRCLCFTFFKKFASHPSNLRCRASILSFFAHSVSVSLSVTSGISSIFPGSISFQKYWFPEDQLQSPSLFEQLFLLWNSFETIVEIFFLSALETLLGSSVRKKYSLDDWEGNELAYKDPQGWDLELECLLVLRLEYSIFTTIFPETMSLPVIFFSFWWNYKLRTTNAWFIPCHLWETCSAYT